MTLSTRDPKRGFTLIEVLMVIVILGVAALIVVPMASPAAGLQVTGATLQLASDLEYARSMAISRGQTYKVVFDPDNRTYEVEDASGNVLAHPVNFGKTYVVNYAADTRFAQISIDEADFDGAVNADGLPEVRFDGLGSPFNADGDPLDSGQVRLVAASESRTVTVEPVTGIISVGE